MSVGSETLLTARVSRAGLVARELEREIVDDREPGERLGTKDDLRKRFGVAVATVKKDTNGLAAIAGENSARNISSPL